LALRACDNRVFLTDTELTPHASVACPGGELFSVHCFANQAFYWLHGNEVWRCDLSGKIERFSDIAFDMVEQAMAEYQRAGGGDVLKGRWDYRPTDPTGSDVTIPSLTIGDRTYPFYWLLFYDAEARLFFLSNVSGPHLIFCIDEEGRPLWCRYLSAACCGLAGRRVDNSMRVASSGCGGVLTWYDNDGNILHRSDPHTAWYDSEVLVLASCVVVVGGTQDVRAYERGELLWKVEPGSLRYGVHQAEGLLMCSYWGADPAPTHKSWWRRARPHATEPKVSVDAYRLFPKADRGPLAT
jgi:hypothetical protein